MTRPAPKGVKELSEGVEFSVQGTPPSVNRYVRHTRSGRHYVTSEAKAFKWAVKFAARGSAVKAKKYSVAYTVYLGKGQRGDVDNFGKLILDSLVDAGVIHSDAAVMNVAARKERDWQNPRTVISVIGLG